MLLLREHESFKLSCLDHRTIFISTPLKRLLVL